MADNNQKDQSTKEYSREAPKTPELVARPLNGNSLIPTGEFGKFDVNDFRFDASRPIDALPEKGLSPRERSVYWWVPSNQAKIAPSDLAFLVTPGAARPVTKANHPNVDDRHFSQSGYPSKVTKENSRIMSVTDELWEVDARAYKAWVDGQSKQHSSAYEKMCENNRLTIDENAPVLQSKVDTIGELNIVGQK